MDVRTDRRTLIPALWGRLSSLGGVDLIVTSETLNRWHIPDKALLTPSLRLCDTWQWSISTKILQNAYSLVHINQRVKFWGLFNSCCMKTVALWRWKNLPVGLTCKRAKFGRSAAMSRCRIVDWKKCPFSGTLPSLNIFYQRQIKVNLIFHQNVYTTFHSYQCTNE